MMKRYGLFIGLVMISVPALAMEEDEPQLEQSVSWWDIVSWPFRPFEVVDSSDAIHRYKQKIKDDVGAIRKKPSNYSSLTTQEKEACDYRFNKLQPVIDNDGDLPTRDQILIYKYGYKCKIVRPILRFVHDRPYSYAASALYYSVLTMGAVKGYRKIKEYLDQKNNSASPATLKNRGEESDCTTMHQDCVWCAMHNGSKQHDVDQHTVEGSK